jgi:hypothetical protein
MSESQGTTKTIWSLSTIPHVKETPDLTNIMGFVAKLEEGAVAGGEQLITVSVETDCLREPCVHCF